MIHFPLASQDLTNDNIAQDMNAFIYSLTGHSVGWEIVENYINFIGWYDGREFKICVNYTDQLKKIQKYVYDECKKWNK